jgi:uncharacterized metal-binding protein YceD (DUF177 family)
MSAFKILIDRLKGGLTQKIEETVSPAFLGPDEPELSFTQEVIVKGETYLAEDHLVVRLDAATQVSMPCSVCNEMVAIDLKVDHFYHAEPIEEIRGAVFDISDALREALLIELPRTIECNGGKCPERANLKPYMRERNETHLPFADMDKE